MSKFIIVIICFVLSGCTEYPTRQLQETKIVGYSPHSDVGYGIHRVVKYEFWIYENTTTSERFTLREKYGEIGDVVKIRR